MDQEKFTTENFQWREYRMFELVKERFAADAPEEKYIFLGHNGHLVKTNARNDHDKRYTGWDVLGAFIHDQYPGDVYAIWNFIGKGRHRGHGCKNKGPCNFDLISGTLEEILYNLSPDQELFFTNSQVLVEHENQIKTVINGKEVAEGKYGSYADAFYFIPVVTDLKP